MGCLSKMILGLMVLLLAACQNTSATTFPVLTLTQTISPRPIHSATTIDFFTYTPFPTLSPAPPTLQPTRSQTIGPTATRTPIPTFDPALIQSMPFDPQPPLPPGMNVEIYALGKQSPKNFPKYCEVQSLLKDKVLCAGEAYNQRNAKWLAGINQTLAPFGYHVERVRESSYAIHQSKKLLLENVDSVARVSVNRSKTDFLMFVSVVNQGYTMLRKDSLKQLRGNQEGLYGKYFPDAWPQFIGDDIIYAAPKYIPEEGDMFTIVYRNDEAIYQTLGPAMGLLSLYDFWVTNDSEGDHWVMELKNEIIIDSASMNEVHGYQNSYMFHQYGSEPVYMFEKDGQFGLNLDGQEIMLPGEHAYHYGCCGFSGYNPIFTGQALAFLLQNGEEWLYVEVTLP